jgi:Mg-chelatase subunit ChlD
MNSNQRRYWAQIMLASLLIFIRPGMSQFMQQTSSNGAEHVAVILVMDNSGSMEASDALGLRYTGIRLFASLLDPGDSIGLILFSTRAEILTNGMIQLASQADKLDFLDSLHFQKANGYTDVKAALGKTKELLSNTDLQGRAVVIVLLTDGRPEIPNPYPGYERETLDLARSLGAPVLAIALTDAARTPFLDQLAAATEGRVYPAKAASDLLDAYLQVLGQVKDRTVIGGRKFQGTGSLHLDPALAPYINSVSVVVAKPEKSNVDLLGPDGQPIHANTANAIFADLDDSRYSILTLENPAGGTYKFRVSGGGAAQAWAILHSRLQLRMIGSGSIHPLGRELLVVVRLLEETMPGKAITIIGEGNFSAQITRPDGSTVSLDQFYDDGTHGDAVANDGDYTRIYPTVDLEGKYLISVQGWKGAVPIQAQGWVNVLQFPALALESPSGLVQVHAGEVALRVHLEGGTPPLFDQGEVVARVLSPSGRTQEIPLHGEGSYSGVFTPTENGDYHVVFETRAVKYLGVDYQTSLEQFFHVTLLPVVHVNVAGINLPAGCLSRPEELSVSLLISSTTEEVLRLSVPDGWRVLPETVTIERGEQTIAVRILPPQGWRGATTPLAIQMQAGNGVELLPAPLIKVEYHLPNIWTRCRTSLGAGGALFLLAAAGAIVFRRARNASRPQPVMGTLRHWPVGENPIQAVEVDLTALGKAHLVIGSGARCDLIVPSAGLEPEHARLSTEKAPGGQQVYLEPLGDVQKGYSPRPARFLLQHGETFRMGTREFQYLSDRGE